MAYINTEETKEIRKAIKKAFPSKDGYKFSITTQHYSKLCIDIMESPFEFKGLERRSGGTVTMCHFEIEDKDLTKEELSFVNKLIVLSNDKNYDDSDRMTDYFDVGYYFQISIGKWDKEYKQYVGTKKEKVEKEAEEVNYGFIKIKNTIYKVVRLSTEGDYTTLFLKTKSGKCECDLTSGKGDDFGFFRNTQSKAYRSIGSRIDMINDIETSNGFK